MESVVIVEVDESVRSRAVGAEIAIIASIAFRALRVVPLPNIHLRMDGTQWTPLAPRRAGTVNYQCSPASAGRSLRPVRRLVLRPPRT